MLQRKLSARALSVLLSTAMCVPLVAAESAVTKIKSNQRTALELQLGNKGSITGKLVDRQGKTLPNVDVLLTGKQGRATVKTDAQGIFQITGLTVGEYGVRVGDQTQVVRMWNPQTAPPKTAQAGLFVIGDTLRGQCSGGAWCDGCDSCNAAPAPTCGPSCGGCDSCGGAYGTVFGGHGNGLLSKPWLLGAGVAAAIAIPIALDDDDAS